MKITSEKCSHCLNDGSSVDYGGGVYLCESCLVGGRKLIRRVEKQRKNKEKVTVFADKKTVKAALKAECDELCRRIIFERDEHKCRCPKHRHMKRDPGKEIQWCHFYSRGVLHVRWDLRNSLTLYAGCHQYWAHKHPDQFRLFMQGFLGDAAFEALEIKKNSGHLDDTIENLEIMKLKLENRLEQLYNPLAKKHGFDKRILNVKIIQKNVGKPKGE